MIPFGAVAPRYSINLPSALRLPPPDLHVPGTFTVPGVDGIPVLDQGSDGTCTACAAILMARSAMLRAKRRLLGEISIGYTQRRGLHEVSGARGLTEVVDQSYGGLPLAATVQGLVDYGVLTIEDSRAYGSSHGWSTHEVEMLFGSLHEFNDVTSKKDIDIGALPSTRVDGAKAHRVYPRVENVGRCLLAGYVVSFSMRVDAEIAGWFSSAEDQRATEYILPLGSNSDDVRLASHAICIIGLDSVKNLFIVRNSMGEGWGDRGNFYLDAERIEETRFSSGEMFILVLE